MKRRPLDRKTPLRAKASLSRSSRPVPRSDGSTVGKPTPRRPVEREPVRGRREWYDFKPWGRCENCGECGTREAHHVYRRSDVERVAPAQIYNLANRWLLGKRCCHPDHHWYGVNDTRLSLSKVPEAAIAFTVDLIGEYRATAYFSRRYRP